MTKGIVIMDNMAIRNFAQIHIPEQLENAHDFNEGPRFHERDDAFDLPEREFVKLFRLKKETAERVIDIVEENSVQVSRSSALNPTIQVFCVGKNLNMAISQPSVSRCIRNVTNILNLPEVFNNWVYFPRKLQELQQLRNKFWVKYQFPGTIGCIDGTHVAIFPPSQNQEFPEHIYVNRKGYHSINVQLICGAELKILNVNARYPGRYDSYIWSNRNVLSIMRLWLSIKTVDNDPGYRQRRKCGHRKVQLQAKKHQITY